ncbi:UDP-4-amino-4,6-dideoxy-N-acetyl-beta-L-altrosamine transaminase [Ferrovibrio sp.]|uniref:UDP-4-amino-4, 6-dideoxy-N-acetyl-beta-L-altrosamine transaminase n=1 Tax=Ferrovibrio sp. TaxID=1917215 RepID=UPI00351211AE
MNASFLPYGRQHIDDEDVAAVVAVLRSDMLTTGPAVSDFEAALSGHAGGADSVVCANGTAALHMAALAAGLGPGDFAVVPAITFLATANAVRLAGAEVMFADVDPTTGLMMPAHVEAALSRSRSGRVKAVFPVHLAGQTADPAGFVRLADQHGFMLIEDACHALGTRYLDARHVVGSCDHSTMTCFSFHPVKSIAMGEGGAVTTRDPSLAQSLRRLRSHGMVHAKADFENRDMAFGPDGQANPWYYEMPAVGLNYRASDIQCALGTSQLTKLPRFLERRRQLVRKYDELFAVLQPVVRPLSRTDCVPGWHLYVVRIDFDAIGMDRGTFMRKLRQQGIGSQVHYIPVSQQPYYRNRYGNIALPGAEEYYRSCLSLPLYPSMNDDDVSRVVAAISAIVR